MPELSANEGEELHASLCDRTVSLSTRELLINIGQHDIRATVEKSGCSNSIQVPRCSHTGHRNGK